MFWIAQQDATEAAVAAGVLGVLALTLLIGLVVSIAINIAVCILIYIPYRAVPMEHQRMQPGLVFLLLIPIFNYFWNFMVFFRVPESFQSCFAAQGRTDVGDCGRGLGMWYAIAALVGAAGSFIPIVNCFAGVIGLASLVLVIIFIVKLWSLKGQLGAGYAEAGGGGAPPPVAPGP